MVGLGVMIQGLAGNEESVKVLTNAVGKTIRGITLLDNTLLFEFRDDTKMSLWDAGQSCCETRYMTTDDDLLYYVGAKFVGIEIKDGPTEDVGYGEEHETQFLEVKTDRGVFTVVTHNEHNGYYGGFCIKAKEG